MVTVEIEKLSDTAGAEILGLDLSKPLSSVDRDAILSLSLIHISEPTRPY